MIKKLGSQISICRGLLLIVIFFFFPEQEIRISILKNGIKINLDNYFFVLNKYIITIC